ncbi:methyltransferase domain-containing protein [Terricaulis sp.]|uniref:methyltransferase domain-containing protein n=1 Tax=Terricaulis sp. TaxID=2768686 RepID=UPI0037835BBE
MAERDYVLGTHDDEIYRLGFQHRVWRPRALDAWARARIGDGCKVIDFGAGPGFATMDLAEMVGPHGEVHALERSRRFLDTLEAQAKARGFGQVKAHEVDVVADPIPVANADAAWARWIFAFLPKPKDALKKLVDALKPGGALVLHEYIDYQTWKLAPAAPNFERFVQEVSDNWRASGGEPDIARDLPAWLTEMGVKIESLRPYVDVVSKDDNVWRWPIGFFDIHIDRLLELNRITPQLAKDMRDEFARVSAQPGTLMVTPLVLEIIARK